MSNDKVNKVYLALSLWHTKVTASKFMYPKGLNDEKTFFYTVTTFKCV